MDTTRLGDDSLDAGYTDEMRAVLRTELFEAVKPVTVAQVAANMATSEPTTSVVVKEPPPPTGKKRAGYTTRKGRGTPKGKRRMAERSRRINRQRK